MNNRNKLCMTSAELPRVLGVSLCLLLILVTPSESTADVATILSSFSRRFSSWQSINLDVSLWPEDTSATAFSEQELEYKLWPELRAIRSGRSMGSFGSAVPMLPSFDDWLVADRATYRVSDNVVK